MPVQRFLLRLIHPNIITPANDNYGIRLEINLSLINMFVFLLHADSNFNVFFRILVSRS